MPKKNQTNQSKPCKCGAAAQEEHPCPYQVEMDGNDDNYCNCCSECTENCAMDV
jgi:hypothetical protein